MVQLEEDEDVVGQPADEESSNEGTHHFEGFGGSCHPVGSKFEEDDGVADEDDDEGDHKTCEEATECDYLVAVLV